MTKRKSKTTGNPQPVLPRTTRRTRQTQQNIAVEAAGEATAGPANVAADHVTPPTTDDPPQHASSAIDNEASNPFLRTAPAPAASRTTIADDFSTSDSDSEGEHFDTPSPSTSVLVTPQSRARGAPRVGPHSTVSPLRPVVVQQQKKKTPPRRKNARDVWEFVKEVPGGYQCTFCQHIHTIDHSHEVFTYSVNSGVSTLRNHFISAHLEIWIEACDATGAEIGAESAKRIVDDFKAKRGGATANARASDRPTDIPEFSNEAFVDAIMALLVAEDLSINLIESPWLRRLFMVLGQDLKDSDIPHRTTIRSKIEEAWTEYKNKLMKDLQGAVGRISMTMDLWSDPNLAPFMAVTAHWIETKKIETPNGPQFELTLRADLIGFHQVPGQHTGEHLAHAFLYLIDRLGIATKIGWITLDNASNNDTFMTHLEFELTARGIPFDRVKNRIRCFPHIINLACKAVIAAFETLDVVSDLPSTDHSSTSNSASNSNTKDPIGALRRTICAARGSSLRRQVFSKFAAAHGSKLQLLRDVDTRWSYTLYMIERALLLEKPLEAFLMNREHKDLRKYRLSDSHFDALVIAREILVVPDAFQQKLSSEKTPTLCNALPCFEAVINIWNEMIETDAWGPVVGDIIQSGIDKLQVYQGRLQRVPAYAISMVLNPMMKLKHVDSTRREDVKCLVLDSMRPYFSSHHQPPLPPPARATTRRAMDYTPRRVQTLGGHALRRTVAARTADEILGLSNSTNAAASIELELDQYLADSRTGTSRINYWQENQLRYPTLFRVALDYLAIQGSAVPCEHVFSSAKETMTDRRNRISATTMEMLQMLKFSMKTGKYLDFSVGNTREEVVATLEKRMDELNAIPDDIDAFIHELVTKSRASN